MAIYLDGEPADRSGVPSTGDAVEQPLDAGVVDRGRELSISEALSAALQFFKGFDRRVQNQRLIEQTKLTHSADGVLRAPEKSSKTQSETLHEGRKR